MHFKINRSFIISKNKAIFYSSACIIALQVCSYSYAIAPEELAAKLACKAVLKGIQEIAEAGAIQAGSEIAQVATAVTGKTVLKAIPTVMLAYQVGKLGTKAVAYTFPTEEASKRALNATDQLQSVQMFESFRTCLLTNPKNGSVIGELGIPTACEIAARQLAKKGAAQEVNELICFYKSPVIKLIIKK